MHKHCDKSLYMQGKKIEPVRWKKGSTIEDIVDNFGNTCFEARNVHSGAELFESMIGRVRVACDLF